MRHRTRTLAGMIIALSVLSAGVVLSVNRSPARDQGAADSYAIDWYTIDGGGDMGAFGGDFELPGTIGQPDAGVVMTGGDFALTGGFWVTADVPPLPPAIATWASGATHASSVLYRPAADGFVEPRTSGICRLRVCFNTGMDTSVTDPGVVYIGGVTGGPQPPPDAITWEGNTCMVIDLAPALPDQDAYTITLSTDVRSAAGVPLGGDRDVFIVALAGDTDGSWLVSNSDVIGVRVRYGQGLSEANCQYDVDCSGAIGNGDMIAVRARRGSQVGP